MTGAALDPQRYFERLSYQFLFEECGGQPPILMQFEAQPARVTLRRTVDLLLSKPLEPLFQQQLEN